jgi:hypothetical protein
VRSYEHRYIGDAATHAAMVNVGGESVDEAFWLSFGDVVAVSGDFFPQRRAPVPASDSPESTPSDPPAPATLFDLARVPGEGGTRLDTRDEIVCALKVATVDEAVKDPRFAPGGRFGHFAFSPRADRSDVERAVRDRYLSLAAVNDDHFVAPGPSDVPTGSGFGSAPSAYHHLHRAALEEAWSLGRAGGDLSRAMAKEAAAQHYLTDAFASGHLRTPVAAIRRYWKQRYPSFLGAATAPGGVGNRLGLAEGELGHPVGTGRVPPPPDLVRADDQDRPLPQAFDGRSRGSVPSRLGQRSRAGARGRRRRLRRRLHRRRRHHRSGGLTP